MQSEIAGQITSHFQWRRDEMLTLLERLVNIDSGTGRSGGITAIVDVLEPLLNGLGLHCERRASEFGPHLVAWGDREPQYLLMGHIDTVFPEGTAAERPFRIEGDRAYGPGVADMKSGIVNLVYVLKALSAVSDAHRHARVLINGDEEVSSPSSRGILRREAAKCRAAFVFEPVRSFGEVVTRRKGVGDLTLRVRGRSAHAGAAPQDGLSANEELACKVLGLQALTDLKRGRSVNVGIMSGGTARNVIPECAEARIDLRFARAADGEALLDEIRKVCLPSRDEYRIELEGGITRPPLEKVPGADPLFAAFQTAGAELGLEFAEGFSGGVSDANLISAVGTPVIDSLGPVGWQAHSPDEYMDVVSMPLRGAAVALAIHRLVHQGFRQIPVRQAV